MGTPVILIEAHPRRPADGATVPVRLAGGGWRKPFHYFGQHWRAGIVGLPATSSSLDFDGTQAGGGGVAPVSEVRFAGADRATMAELAALYWTDAAVTMWVGPEGDVPPPVDLTGLVVASSVEDGRLRLAFADRAAGLKRPVLVDRFAGTGGIEGPAEWAGEIRTRAWGRCFNLRGRLIHQPANIWCFGDPARSWDAFVELRDRGIAARPADLRLLEWQGSVQATFAALVAAAAPAGGGVVAPSIACVKWWTRPAGDLYADIRGENAGGYVETAPQIAERIVAGRSLLAFAPGEIAAATTARPAAFGWRIASDGATIAGELSEVLADVSLSWTVRSGAIELRRWDWTAPVRHARSHRVSRRETGRPVATRKLGYRRNAAPMARGDLAAAILAADLVLSDGRTLDDLGREVTAIASDTILSRGEKPAAVLSWQTLFAEVDALYQRYAELNEPADVTAPLNAAQVARQALGEYLMSLAPRWDDASVDTSIDPVAWQTAWRDAIDALAIARTAISGRKGDAAPLVRTQWSIDGSTNWHDNYFGADRYYRQSNDGGATWGPAVLGVGEDGARGADGSYLDNVFARAATLPTMPPQEWYDAPPATAFRDVYSSARDHYPTGDVFMRCQPGEVYRITGYIAAENSNHTCNLGLNFMREDGTMNWIAAAGIAARTAGFIDATITVPAGCIRMRPWAQMDGVDGLGSMAYHFTLENPPALWLSTAKRNGDGSFATAWSPPVRISGADGKDGANGTSALSAYLTNPSFQHQTDAAGAPEAIPNGIGNGQMRVLVGDIDVTSQCSFTAQLPFNLFVTVDAAGNYSATNLSGDTGYAFIVASYNGRAISLRLSASRSRAGADGRSPPSIAINASAQVIVTDAVGNLTLNQAVTFSATRLNTSAPILWQVHDGSGIHHRNFGGDTYVTDFADLLAITNYPAAIGRSNTRFCTVSAICDGVVDSVTVITVFNGANGVSIKGDDGLTAQVHTAYANSANGQADFHLSDPVGRRYLGIYKDFVAADSTDPAAYAWSLIKGEDGTSPYALSLGSAALVLNATYAGVTKEGQLPRDVPVTVRQGSNDVTGALTIGVAASANIAASYAGGLLTVTAANADGYIDVTASVGSTVIDTKRLTISRKLDAQPPQTATGQSTTVGTGNPAATTYQAAPTTGIMTLQVPADGQMPVTLFGSYTTVRRGSSTAPQSYVLGMKMMYRAAGSGGAWSDLGGEYTGTAAYWYSNGEGEPGDLYASFTASLTAGASYEFGMLIRKYGGDGNPGYVDRGARVGV